MFVMAQIRIKGEMYAYGDFALATISNELEDSVLVILHYNNQLNKKGVQKFNELKEKKENHLNEVKNNLNPGESNVE